ncbi:replication initiator [Planobispora longispora]|uniref:Replication initiation protein n=1 Tax=Planobispora longispora TaxID=28887 RepID=A0A8J3RJY3_9ACTN|nr:replication initiator [Planobispora longispora]BFE82596.1 replication initiator protein RepSA [Planobispora longispora]GIH77876.1 replication initiation protein [Planobispora longispora]
MSDVPPFSPDILAAVQRAAMPDFARWQRMVYATGGCAQPVRLHGERLTVDAGTGEVLDIYRTADEPTGFLLTACGNRRASRCPSCSATYRDDTYHLIISGLRGGKGVPEDVSEHPRVFATFTAPSFGAVHARREKNGKVLPCRPRRDFPVCEHGRPESCGTHHDRDDPQLGQPLCMDCYDYRNAVLWNAHAGRLWREFTKTVPSVFARLLGVSRTELRRMLRLSYAKVAEYQARGLVHFHAVIRLDGPEGPTDRPPDWATVPMLDQMIRQAARQVTVSVPDGHRLSLALGWGDQLDVRPVYVSTELDGVSDQRVASYVAKYATKGAESAGAVDRPIRNVWDVTSLDVTEHARRMILTCFVLGDLPQYRDVPLRQWAHMLGYGGHFSTKSRHYSITLGDLRQARADHRAMQARAILGLPDPAEGETITVQDWRYAGSGHRHGEAFWAEHIRQRITTARRIARYEDERSGPP